MTDLIGHAKAARILAQELLDQAESELAGNHPDVTVAALLARLSGAHYAAAERMEQAMREESTGSPANPLTTQGAPHE